MNEENVLGPLTDEQQDLVDGLREDAVSRYMDGDHEAIRRSVAMKPHDPAFVLLLDGKVSVPVVHRGGCYICEDPEFAAMGLPLCFPCPACVRKQEVCGACQGTGGYPDKDPVHRLPGHRAARRHGSHRGR